MDNGFSKTSGNNLTEEPITMKDTSGKRSAGLKCNKRPEDYVNIDWYPCCPIPKTWNTSRGER
jgi:hypothetical protein